MLALLFGGLVLLLWASLLFSIRQLKKRAWDHCPEVRASLVSADVYEDLRKPGRYVAGFTYRYSIAGHEHSGLSGKLFPTVGEAVWFIRKCERETFVVRYKPACPSDSLLFRVPNQSLRIRTF